jgi:hypothetical protein
MAYDNVLWCSSPQFQQSAWYVVGIMVGIVIMMLLPYEVTKTTVRGQSHRLWRASLWTWEQRPNYMHFRLDGVYYLQQALLVFIKQLWHKRQNAVLKQVVAAFKRWLP